MKRRVANLVWALFTVACCLTYLFHLHKPNAPFWDENYYITTTQRYLDNVAQIEPHPPLGLMVVAAGEYLFKSNQHLSTHHLGLNRHVSGDQIPEGYSFFGIRFFPALFGALCLSLLFKLIHNCTQSLTVALGFSLLLLFENSFYAHFRAAHLDSIQLFCIIASLLHFTILWRKSEAIALTNYFSFGVLCISAMLVKVNGVILILLMPLLIVHDLKITDARHLGAQVIESSKKILSFAGGVVVTTYVVFSLHAVMGSNPVSLDSPAGRNILTQTSHTYQSYLAGKSSLTPLVVSSLIRDYVLFINKDHRGVPKLNICKSGENGSHPSSWLFNKRTINYRWDSKDGYTKYIQLVGNQINWAVGLVGLILASTIVIGRRVLESGTRDESTYQLIEILLGFYAIFMAMHLYLADQRVMYLYHYFTGFTLSILLCALCFKYVVINNYAFKSRAIRSLLIVVLVSATNFTWLAPLSFHLELSKNECEARNFLQKIVICQ